MGSDIRGPRNNPDARRPFSHASDAKLWDDPACPQFLTARTPMLPPLPDPDVADIAPSGPDLTVYDEEHGITYLRLLDADAEGADWRDVARIVLHLDPEHESDRAWRAFESHLARAKWMTEHGYRQLLLRGDASA
jgi:hypothetical protein